MIGTMMIAVSLGQSPLVSPAPPPPVTEWANLPLYPLPRGGAVANATFVRGEVEAGRCRVPSPTSDSVRLDAPVAILVGPSGLVRQIVPRAIDCPTVEQYTVGYLLSLTRAGPATPPAPGWYRLTVSYGW